MGERIATIDADGWLTLPFAVTAGTTLTVACPPGWLTARKFQILDQPARIAVTRRIARLRTSGAMPVVQTMETIYRTHAQTCRYQAGENRLHLPPQVRAAFAPLPCEVRIANEDGALTVRGAAPL